MVCVACSVVGSQGWRRVTGQKCVRWWRWGLDVGAAGRVGLCLWRWAWSTMHIRGGWRRYAERATQPTGPLSTGKEWIDKNSEV